MASSPQLTIADINPRLIGLGDFRAKARAEGYDDSHIESSVIPEAVRSFERDTRFRCTPIRVVTADDGTYSTGITDTVVRREMIPYDWDASQFHMRFRAQEFPIRRILRLRLMLNTNNQMMQFPDDWVQYEPVTGYVWLQPVTGAAFGQSAAAYAILERSYAPSANTNYPSMISTPRVTPAMIALDYDAGLPDGWATDQQWADIRRALTCRVARMVLADLSQVFDAGLVSKTVTAFGVSQSAQMTRFQDRIAQLQAEEDAIVAPLRGESGPIFMGVI